MHLHQIMVLTDGRGGNNQSLDGFLQELENFFNTEIIVRQFPGMKIEEICRIADELIEQKPEAIYYIMAGGYDLLQKSPFGQRFFTHEDEEELFESVQKLIASSITYMRQRHSQTMIHFATITGVELSKACSWTQGESPQKVLNNAVYWLNDHIHNINEDYGTATPDTASIVHSNQYPRYYLLDEGVTCREETALCWARILLAHMETHY